MYLPIKYGNNINQQHSERYVSLPRHLRFMKQDVAAYMKYYTLERLHSANGDLSPVEFENSQLKVSNLG